MVRIPRSENDRADYLSRICDHDDWGISDVIFELVESLWGPRVIKNIGGTNKPINAMPINCKGINASGIPNKAIFGNVDLTFRMLAFRIDFSI
jgi:hypothetical protein